MLMPEMIDEPTPEQRRQEAGLRYRRNVQDLLNRRGDLQGVSQLADLICDGTRWAA